MAARPPAVGAPGRHRLPWRHGLRRGGSWSGTGFRGGSASGGGLWSAHGAYGGTASGGGQLLARDQPLWHDGVSLVSLWHDGLWHDGLRRVPLLRWHLRGVPSAHYRELLWLLVRQLRGLVHRQGGAAGAAVGMVAGAAVASANTAAATSSATTRQLRCWRDHHRICHGRDLCDAPDWLRRIRGLRHNLLPLRHDVVPAVLRRERRLLPCGADALRWLAPVPLVHPASGTGHEENHMRHKENHMRHKENHMRLHVCIHRATYAWAIVLGLIVLVMASPTHAQPVDIPLPGGRLLVPPPADR